jgi:hypothetical protein
MLYRINRWFTSSLVSQMFSRDIPYRIFSSYPSGRLVVLRLQPPQTCTLFFDDTDSPEHQFLGLVTSTGSVLIMLPTLCARFVTDHLHERGYLCDGEKLERLKNNFDRIQLNPSMQLEYSNSLNIRFAFAYQKEEYKFQLDANPALQMSASLDASNNLSKKHSADKRRSFPTPRIPVNCH